MVMDATFDTTASVSMTVTRWDVCCAMCRLRRDCTIWAATMGSDATCWIMRDLGQITTTPGANVIAGRVYRCHTKYFRVCSLVVVVPPMLMKAIAIWQTLKLSHRYESFYMT
jgi:hypothetical protein